MIFQIDLSYGKWAIYMTGIFFLPLFKCKTGHFDPRYFAATLQKKLAKTVPKDPSLALQVTDARMLGNFPWHWGLKGCVSFPPDANRTNHILREAQSLTPHGRAVTRLVLQAIADLWSLGAVSMKIKMIHSWTGEFLWKGNTYSRFTALSWLPVTEALASSPAFASTWIKEWKWEREWKQ